MARRGETEGERSGAVELRPSTSTAASTALVVWEKLPELKLRDRRFASGHRGLTAHHSAH
jgi:hypothetical protein